MKAVLFGSCTVVVGPEEKSKKLLCFSLKVIKFREVIVTGTGTVHRGH